MRYQKLDDKSSGRLESVADESLIARLQKSSRITVLHFLLLYSIIGFLVVGLIAEIKGQLHIKSPMLEVYSPANEAIRYRRYRNDDNNFLAGASNEYMVSHDTGLPTPETDQRWLDLYNTGPNDYTVGPLVISEDQARPLQAPTLQAADSSSYVLQLEVFHQMHCLNVIRRTLYLDHYLETWTDEELAPFLDFVTPDRKRNYTSLAGLHMDHCVDALRQAILCHGDASAISWQWEPTKRFPMPSFTSERQCVDYDHLKHWAVAHHMENDRVSLAWGEGPEERLTYSKEGFSVKRDHLL